MLLGEEWWASHFARAPPGSINERIVAFAHQFLDLLSPSNVAWLNPEVINATGASGGVNLTAGLRVLRD